jgi:hypothetical protein
MTTPIAKAFVGLALAISVSTNVGCGSPQEEVDFPGLDLLPGVWAPAVNNVLDISIDGDTIALLANLQAMYFSEDLGKTWTHELLDTYYYGVHVYDARIFGFKAIQRPGTLTDEYVVVEYSKEAREFGDPLPGRFRTYVPIHIRQNMLRAVSVERNVVQWLSLDLDSGLLEQRGEAPWQAPTYPYLYSADGEAFANVSIDLEDVAACLTTARPQAVSGASPLALNTTCYPGVHWPGLFAAHDPRDKDTGSTARIFATDASVRWAFSWNGEAFAAPLPESDTMPGVDTASILSLGPGNIAPFEPNRINPYFPGLLELHLPNEESKLRRRFVHIADDDSIYEAMIPSRPCSGGELCRDTDSLVAATALDGSPLTATRWLMVWRTETGGYLASARPSPTVTTVFMQVGPVTMQPYSASSGAPYDAEFAGCTAAPTRGGALDEACAIAAECGEGFAENNMVDCMTRWLEATPELVETFIANPCPENPYPYDLARFTCESPPGPRCDGTRILSCPGTLGYGPDCARLDGQCSIGTLSPYDGRSANHCGGTFGCDILLTRGSQPDRALQTGICQGDKLFYKIHEALRYVDCAALANKTCVQGIFYARCGE